MLKNCLIFWNTLYNLSYTINHVMYFGFMVVNVTKISHKRKNKGLFSIEKIYREWEKLSYYNYKKAFWFKSYYFSIRKSIKKFRFWKVISWNIRKLQFLKYKNIFGVSVSRKLADFLRKYTKFFQSRIFRKDFWGQGQKVLGDFYEEI